MKGNGIKTNDNQNTYFKFTVLKRSIQGLHFEYATGLLVYEEYICQFEAS